MVDPEPSFADISSVELLKVIRWRALIADHRRYERDYPGRGERFVTAVHANRRGAPAIPALLEPDIRSAKVPRFPYRVVFGDAIQPTLLYGRLR